MAIQGTQKKALMTLVRLARRAGTPKGDVIDSFLKQGYQLQDVMDFVEYYWDKFPVGSPEARAAQAKIPVEGGEFTGRIFEMPTESKDTL